MASGTEVGKGYVGVSAETKGLQSELTSLGGTLGAKMGPVGAVLGNKLGAGMGTGMQAGLGGSKSGLSGLVGLLGKGGPWGIAAEVAVGSAAAVGAALYKMGGDFESQYRTIARNTGATGSDLDHLKTAFKDVASHSAASFGQVTEAISEVQRFTGPTGASLDILSGHLLTLSRITGTDVKQNTEAAVHAFENWNIAQKDAPKAMDQLFTASQKSGVGFASLAQQVTQFGPPLRTMGFSFADSTSMLATFGKTGANTPRIMAAMQLSATKLASENSKAGDAVDKAREAVSKANDAMGKAKPGSQGAIDAAKKLADAQGALKSAEEDQAKASGTTVPQAFAEQVKAIKDSTDQTDALNKASDLFGSRGAAQMVDAIKTGKFNFDEMSKSVKDSNDSISETGKRTGTLGGSFSKMKNATKVAFEPLSTATFKGINRGLMDVMNWVTPMVTWFGQNLPGAITHTVNAFKDVYKWIDKAVRGVYEATTPLRHMIGETFTVMARLMSDAWAVAQPIFRMLKDAFTIIIDLLRGDWKGAWNAAKDFVLSALRALENIPKLLFDYITAPFASIGPGVADALHGFWDTVAGIPGKIGGFLAGLGTSVWNAISGGFSTAWDAVTSALASFWAGVTGLPQQVFDTLAGLGTSVWNALSGGFGQAVAGAGAGLASLWGWVQGIAGQVGSTLAGVGTAVWNALKGGFDQAVEGAKIGASTLWSWVTGLAGEIKTKIGDLGGTLLQKGKDLVQGFVNGITSLPHIISDKLKSLVPGPLKAFAGALGLGSPSKIFYQFGVDTLQGYINGLDSMAGPVKAAMLRAAPGPGAVGSALGGGGVRLGRSGGGPAVVFQDAVFRETLDLSSAMRQVAWEVEKAGI